MLGGTIVPIISPTLEFYLQLSIPLDLRWEKNVGWDDDASYKAEAKNDGWILWFPSDCAASCYIWLDGWLDLTWHRRVENCVHHTLTFPLHSWFNTKTHMECRFFWEKVTQIIQQRKRGNVGTWGWDLEILFPSHLFQRYLFYFSKERDR